MNSNFYHKSNGHVIYMERFTSDNKLFANSSQEECEPSQHSKDVMWNALSE